jgi:hypothetical protein
MTWAIVMVGCNGLKIDRYLALFVEQVLCTHYTLLIVKVDFWSILNFLSR